MERAKARSGVLVRIADKLKRDAETKQWGVAPVTLTCREDRTEQVGKLTGLQRPDSNVAWVRFDDDAISYAFHLDELEVTK